MSVQTRSTMNEAQALEALRNLTLSDAYRAMSAQEKYNHINAIALGTSMEATGSTTVLYSGSVSDGVSANDVVVAMSEAGEDIRIINKTDAAKFLTSDDFNKAMGDIAGIRPEQFASFSNEGLNLNAEQIAAKKFLTDQIFHATEGPWAVNSERFAAATVGDVRLIAPDAPSNRTFATAEQHEQRATPCGQPFCLVLVIKNTKKQGKKVGHKAFFDTRVKFNFGFGCGLS